MQTVLRITKEEMDKYYIKYYQKNEKYKTGISGMGDIAEDLGECAGVGGMFEESWYHDAMWEAEDYAKKEYNFEHDILKMSDAKFKALCNTLSLSFGMGDKVHTLAAYAALEMPAQFDALITSIRDVDQDEMYAHFSGYEKEVERCRDVTEKDLRHDFVSGDYRGNFEGIERMLEKMLDAESVDVQGYDAVSITFDTDTLKEKLSDAIGSKDVRRAKAWAIDLLVRNAKHYKDMRASKAEARKIERERVEKYQAERAAIAEKERHEKLDAIRK